MITLVKIGGSLITNKTVKASFRAEVMQHIAQQISNIITQHPQHPIILGHGSGSFGHFEAKYYNTAQGVSTLEEWFGFTRVAFVASELNRLVIDALHNAKVSAFRFQPSASLIAKNGVIQSLNLDALNKALSVGLLPVVYGDVAFDMALGGTIASTETVFTYLVQQLPVSRVFLLGEVDGVYDLEHKVIPHITSDNYTYYQSALGGSEGVDVTGGMLTKVSDMLSLVQSKPSLSVRIFNGLTANTLTKAFDNQSIGTLITA